MTVHVNKMMRHRLPLSMKELRRYAYTLLERFGIDAAEVSVTFVDDDIIRDLNRKYRGNDRETDVLAFELSEPEDDMLLGDIYISMDRVKDQARANNVRMKEETLRLLIHGVLHLCGYGDDEKSGREEMFKMQENLVKGFLEGGR